MSKKILLLVTSMFSLLLFFSVVQIDASEVSKPLYPDYIEDEKLAEKIVDNTNFISITDKYTSKEFQEIAEDVTELRIDGDDQISSLEGLQYFTGLEELNVSYLDDSITTIPEQINALVNLEYLEISNSNIKTIDNLTNLKKLKTLYLDSNQIEKIEGLGGIDSLEELYLGFNKIKDTKGLDGLDSLEILSLGFNKIEEIKELDELGSLRSLVLDNNQIEEIKGLDELHSLTDLYLNNNQIEEIKGLDELGSLRSLTLDSNQIIDTKSK